MGKNRFETSLGGPRGAFPETTWSMVSRLRDADTTDRRPGVEKLCQRYWKPIYQYVRAAWAKKNEEAKDLTQAFFMWLVEGDTIAKYSPEKGAFRAYLKGLLRHYTADYHKALGRLKRGGGVNIFPLNDDVRALQDQLKDPKADQPNQAFDHAWKKEIFDAALERTKEHFSVPEREVQFKVFEEYDISPTMENPTYELVAQKLGIKESDVRNHLFAVRERFRDDVQRELQETCSDLSELQEEWHDLFS